MKIKYIVTVTAFAVSFAANANAGIIYSAGSSGPMSTNQEYSLTFDSSVPTANLSFVIDGYRSLDGQNFYEDDFSLKLNDTLIFSGTFNLGGGSNSGSQSNIYYNPYGASFTNLTGNGTGIGWNGGQELLSFAGLPLNVGPNKFTFSYTSLDPNHAGFQGSGDEAWGVDQVKVSTVPGPTIGAGAPGAALGALLLGWFMKRRSRRFA